MPVIVFTDVNRWRRAGTIAVVTATSAVVILLIAGASAPRTRSADPMAVGVAVRAAGHPAVHGRLTRHAQPALRCVSTAHACVDLRHRLAWLQVDGKVTYGPVPTGTALPGHGTPRGVFRVEWKAEHWTSTEYGIPMPWSVFFAAGGIALHAGPLDAPSHGCVHLSPAAAHRFFDALVVGDRVDVH
jgi:L,D-transpeptidase catalytic domain